MFDPKEFEETVSTVASESAESDESMAKRRAAEAELLDKVIGMARPALKAIGTRPQIKYHMAHHADCNYGGGVQTEERYRERCVPLSAGGFGPDEDCPRANEGSYEGKDLAVRSDGKLIQLEYSGSWSRWQGSSYGYEAEVTEYNNAAEAIKDGWTEVDTYIENLNKQLKSAVGKRKDRIKADQSRAEKISAVSSLLKK